MRPSLTPSPHTDLPTVFADAHLRVVAHYNDATMPGDDNAACQLLLKRSMVFACAHMAVCLLFTVRRLQPDPSSQLALESLESPDAAPLWAFLMAHP